MTATDHDRDLEHLLRDDGGEWGALYRKLSRVEPPRRLDRNVLGEAARAVHGRAPRGQRWLVGLSSAAGIVFAVGIAWHIGRDALRNPTQPAFNTTPTVQSRDGYVPVERIHAPSAAPASPAMQAEISRETEAASAAPSPAESAPQAFPAAAARQRVAAKTAAAPAPAAAPPVATPPAAAATGVPVPAPTAPAGAATAAVTQGDGSGVAAEATAAGSLAISGDADTAVTSERSKAQQATELKRSAELRNDLRLPPAAWIRRIRWLLDQGRREQALESLHLLRRTHPDVELPADLAALP